MAYIKKAGNKERLDVYTNTGLYGTDYASARWSRPSGWAPIGRKTPFIRPPRPTPKASRTTAPTST